MTIITNTTLLIRRIGEVRRRREAIVDRQDRLRGSLPQWALAPLQLVGMTAAEIQGLMTELSEAEKQAGLEDVERELEQLDQQIEELENLLLDHPVALARRHPGRARHGGDAVSRRRPSPTRTTSSTTMATPGS